ncbi:HpcH/HpaI aldolase/citrate lyase family protein [Sphingomonas sp. BAUL-RG-20F-R05-02]|uniref:HpcH/HpaI aldolase/citrate lyase family protein n=1 Tax=Sphingomonas sp. BAUL-RG-20F-R05-02 TaxID=2914830 RepID=UPI001F56143D|nr:CoA ester lyase [Sphingomonas sp. BAUL-RG-20F-R05-02]
MRSKLFVPCSRPDFFAKALASEADALSFDLEDSVPADGKAVARERLRKVLQSDMVAASPKRMIVRVNAADTPHFADDLAALAGVRVDLLNLPKADAAQAVCRAITRMDAARVTADVLVNIEAAAGLANVAEIAGAHRRVVGVQVGLNDLFAALGMERHDQRHVHSALWAIRLGAAAAASPVFAYDGAWPDLRDDEGYRAEAQMARSLGYLGKSCIHPRQIAIANEIFDRGSDLSRARRLLLAATSAAKAGHGAFVFEGAMVDEPALAAARALVDDMAPAA